LQHSLLFNLGQSNKHTKLRRIAIQLNSNEHRQLILTHKKKNLHKLTEGENKRQVGLINQTMGKTTNENKDYT